MHYEDADELIQTDLETLKALAEDLQINHEYCPKEVIQKASSAILELIANLEDAQGEIRALRATEAGLRDRLAELESDCDRLERYWNEAMATHKNIAELERRLEEARKDAELLDYIQTNGATVEIIPGAPDFYPVHFRVGGRYRTANENIRAAIRAAIKEQT